MGNAPPTGNAPEEKSRPGNETFGVKKGGTAMLLIDPQNDFMEGGSLAVTGGIQDSKTIAALIKANMDSIHQITVTLDAHLKMHIANPFFWVNQKGEHPPPFTSITQEDIEAGTWHPSRKELLGHCKEYTAVLKAGGKFTLLIWPEHCLIGTHGQNVQADLNDALQEWSGHNLDIVHYVNKGTCPFTEMYSGLSAEMPMHFDKGTQMNHTLINRLLEADRVVVGGEALSHCVQFTVRDMLTHWPKERMKDVILLSDASSSVGGFEASGDGFRADLVKMGCLVMKSSEVFPASAKASSA